MKLLIITQKIDRNDPVLGFFHRWLEEFAKHCSAVVAICLEKGEFNLPDNVRVFSLGKEKNGSRVRYLGNFYRYIWRERNNYEAVFVHMNPEYVVLGGLFWRSWHKAVAFWYTHKSVNFRLKLAAKLAHIIFTASRASFRLASGKVKIVGHGIDTEFFRPRQQRFGDQFKVVNIGRISLSKNQLLLVKIFSKLLPTISRPVVLSIVGAPALPDDRKYFQQIIDYISDNTLGERVKLIGPVPQNKLINFYQDADLLVNLSQTGSLDKDVLEAAACNVDILTTNEAYRDELPGRYLANQDEASVSQALHGKIERPESVNLRPWVMANHSLEKLTSAIINHLQND